MQVQILLEELSQFNKNFFHSSMAEHTSLEVLRDAGSNPAQRPKIHDADSSMAEHTSCRYEEM
jgi:hypothetical protein